MADQTPTSAPLLNLETFTERASVVIDGVTYTLRNRGELSILAGDRLDRHSHMWNTIYNRRIDAPEENDDKIAGLVLRSMCSIVLDAPMEILEKLPETEQLKVVNAFMELRPSPANPAGATSEASPTGELSSPNSSGSIQEAAT